MKNKRGVVYMVKTKSVVDVKEIPEKIICDACGREIEKINDGIFADYYKIEKTWGYFSEKDGRQDSFDICEKCYDKMLKAIGLQNKISE